MWLRRAKKKTIGAMTHISTLLDRFIEALLQQRRSEQARDEARGHRADEHEVIGDDCSRGRVSAENSADAGDEASAGHGSGLGVDLGAKHVPRDIRSQVFAAHDTRGHSFDDGALLCGHGPDPGNPLVDRGGRDVELACESGLAAEVLAGEKDRGGWRAHAGNIAVLFFFSKQSYAFVSLASLDAKEANA